MGCGGSSARAGTASDVIAAHASCIYWINTTHEGQGDRRCHRCRGGAEAADEAVEHLEASVRRLEQLAADPGAVVVREPRGIAR